MQETIRDRQSGIEQRRYYLTRSDIEARDRLVFAFICRYALAHAGHTPTLRCIMENCAVTSTSIAASCVERLVNTGKLDYVDDKLVIVGAKYQLPEGIGEGEP